MPWSGLLNHDAQIERFQRSFAQNRLAHTYLFVGQPGIGKRQFALRLAEALLCETRQGTLEGCGVCSGCVQVQAQTHPDLIQITKPEDKANIPIELFIGDNEHRRQEGLIHDIGLKPFRGGRKIAIIDDADYLQADGANSLLKTLEEPPPESLLILLSTSEHQQLRTIVSRSQVVRFSPLEQSQVRQLLQQSGLETEIPLEVLATAAEGSMVRAMRLAESEMFEFRTQLYRQLASGDPGKNEFVKSITSFIDAAGSEGAVKRERLIFLAELAISFYRGCYCALSTPELANSADESLRDSIEEFVHGLKTREMAVTLMVCAESIERSLDLQWHVQSNVNAANSIDAWLIQLGRIFHRKA